MKMQILTESKDMSEQKKTTLTTYQKQQLNKKINLSHSNPIKSALERELLHQLHLAKLPIPIHEFKFHPTRRWSSDFCWPEQKLIVEVEGGVYSKGRHVRGKGFEEDCFKYNEATKLGYKVIRVTGKYIKNGQALNWIEDILDKFNEKD